MVECVEEQTAPNNAKDKLSKKLSSRQHGEIRLVNCVICEIVTRISKVMLTTLLITA